MIQVLLTDDHDLVRTGLRRVLEEARDIQVIAEACNGQEAIQNYRIFNPDVVVMDISMPGMDGLEAVKRIIFAYPDACILVLTMYPEEQYAVRTLKAGCLGYLTKGTSTKQLHDAVRAVACGQRFLSEEGKNAVTLQLLANKSNTAPVDALSDRELQVLCLVARGLKMKDVAMELGLSVRTVETYRHRLLQKLCLRNNADISRFAFQNQFI